MKLFSYMIFDLVLPCHLALASLGASGKVLNASASSPPSCSPCTYFFSKNEHEAKGGGENFLSAFSCIYLQQSERTKCPHIRYPPVLEKALRKGSGVMSFQAFNIIARATSNMKISVRGAPGDEIAQCVSPPPRDLGSTFY